MKKRIIPSILLSKGSNVCLSREFSPWRTISLNAILRLHVQRGADELLVINLDSAGILTSFHPENFFYYRNKLIYRLLMLAELHLLKALLLA